MFFLSDIWWSNSGYGNREHRAARPSTSRLKRGQRIIHATLCCLAFSAAWLQEQPTGHAAEPPIVNPVLPSPSECNHSTAALYWDESNLTSPNFHDYLSGVSIIQQGIGGLPVLWWQMPMGVPSATPGGTPGHYRDNRVHYILTHPAEFTKVGGVGVVFSAGATNQTTILTDGGQFQNLWKAYIKTPAAL